MELKFYNRPFRLHEYSGWVYDSKDNFVFQFDEENEFDENGNYTFGIKEFRNRVMLSLNSINHEPITNYYFKVNPKSAIEILKNDSLLITIRGWGNLTGIGGYNFSQEKAIIIQNDFRDWIIYKLSNK